MPGIVWWEVETPGPERFQAFHSALWGWTFVPAFAETELDADYWIVRDGDESVGGLQRSSASAAPPSTGIRLYVAVDDLEASLARVVALGGSVERSRLALGGDDRWCGIVRDPTGISWGLWTRHPAGDPDG